MLLSLEAYLACRCDVARAMSSVVIRIEERLMKRLIFLVAGACLASAAPAQLVDFEAFANNTAGVMFQAPNFSGSTSANITAGSTSSITDAAPANPFAPSSTRAVRLAWSFVDAATTRWARITTASAPNGYPNPTISFTDTLSFDVYSTVSMKLALGVRETGTSAAIWANGGTTGTIEWVSNGGLTGTTPPGGMTIAANQWTHITLNLAALSGAGNVQAFTGNGVLDGSKGVLEHLAVTSLGNAGPYTVYVDNFQVAPVPEPASLAALGLGLAGLIARRRRK
jgi:hypothetical protein